MPRLDRNVNLAIYLFPMELACERSCTSINLGGAVAVLTDGVFRHKRAWGARATPRAETHTELLVGWREPGAAALRFLADASLVYRAGSSLASVSAILGDQPADPREGARLWRALPAAGIGGLTVMAQDGWLPTERGWNMPASVLLELARRLSSSELIAARNARASTAGHP